MSKRSVMPWRKRSTTAACWTSSSAASQTVTNTYLYQAYDNISASSGSTINPFRLIGQLRYCYEYPSTPLTRARARHFSPAQARWISRDRLGFAGRSGICTNVWERILSCKSIPVAKDLPVIHVRSVSQHTGRALETIQQDVNNHVTRNGSFFRAVMDSRDIVVLEA